MNFFLFPSISWCVTHKRLVVEIVNQFLIHSHLTRDWIAYFSVGVHIHIYQRVEGHSYLWFREEFYFDCGANQGIHPLTVISTHVPDSGVPRNSMWYWKSQLCWLASICIQSPEALFKIKSQAPPHCSTLSF